MMTARGLYHLVRADFLERTRRYSFLIILGLTVWGGYLFVPPATATYATLAMEDYRGVYNSAWIGGMVAVMTATFLSLPGFYLVKGAITRDRDTGVGQILAATPLSRPAYTLGKLLSNFLVLAAIVGILALVTAGMQLVRGEDLRIAPWVLAQPFVFGVLPAMAVVAAVAVLFDTLPGLRGGLGNVIYFFLWIFVLIGGTVGLLDNDNGPQPGNDLFGISYPVADMAAAVKQRFPDYGGDVAIGFTLEGEGQTITLETFRWEGQVWTLPRIASRLLWLAVAVGLALGAAVFFDRFDGTPAGRRKTKDDGRQTLSSGSPQEKVVVPAGIGHLIPEAALASPATLAAQVPSSVVHRLSSLPPARFSLLTLLAAEMRLLLKGQRWWWYAGAAGLVVAGLVSGPQAVRQFVLPLTWLWPILIWSGLGSREQRHGTAPIVFSAARPLARQLPAAWLAGALVAMLTGAGAALTLLRGGDVDGLLAWGAGSLFIPALALALGTLSGGGKLFEMLYVVWWYMGPMSGAPGLDFLGARHAGLWPYYALLAIGLVAAAWASRWRQLRQ